MARIANPGYFRAEAVGIDWSSVAKSHGQQLPAVEGRDGAADARRLTLRLAWACHGDLGVPHGVFTVWRRPIRSSDASRVEASVQPTGDGSLRLDWGTPAGRVVIDCGVVDPSQPVVVRLCWRTGSKESVTAIGTSATGSATAHLELRTPGATCATITNGFDPVARIVSLDDIVNAPDWEPLEYVGLPVPKDGLPGTDYDGFEQGPVTATVPARDAALDRLARGAPPVGWSATLPSGVAAPPWQGPDPAAFVDSLTDKLLGRIAALYTPGLPENRQAGLTNPTPVDGPPRRTASIDAAPWPLLAIPVVSDPFANLALGFGTAYPLGSARAMAVAVAQQPVPEFLVTASYSVGPVFRASGPGWIVEVPLPAGEYAAYAPPVPHAQTPAPLPYVAARYSLQPPLALDAPWRENVRSTWPPLPADAGTVHVTQFAPVRTAQGAPTAEPLFAFDPDVDGWRIPNIPPLAPDATLLSSVDPTTEIPLGSGGRNEFYAAALSDVYGVWSPWSEALYSGVEPAASPPMLANLTLRSTYAGSPQCPASLDVQAMVEFTERSTTSVEFSAVFYPMNSPSMPPPAGIGAEAVPAGGVRRTFSLSFAADVPSGVGCTVAPLDENGLPAPAAGPGQGEPRRFAVHVDLPPLDFSVTDRWGVAVWARRELTVGPTPTAWAPDDPARAMLASAGSPVPVVPATTPLPGVPLASLPDSEGHSHVRVEWGAGSSSVKSFVIWQASEQYLRERCGVPEPAADVVPGARLVAVRQLLIDHPEVCRLAFRRVLEVPGDRRDADVALARGATGIQFFVVTSTTPTGADSPWPYNSAGHDVTQVFIAPRLVSPAQPLARPEVTSTGADVGLEVPSEVPVSRFRVYRTHAFDAARRADSMGAPQFVAATAPANPPAPADVDLVTGLPVFRGRWTGALEQSWKAWYVRVVAEPDTSGMPERAWRGVLSPASDIVTVRLPPTTPPDLDPLVVESVSPDHSVLVARTSTSAPIGDTDFGPHLVGGLTAAALAAADLDAAPLVPLSSLADADPPAPAAGAAVVVRGARAGGRTPLAVWFTRADPAQPVDVGLRLVDPLGRAAVQLAQVAGWTAPQPPNLELVAVTRVSATAAVVTVSSTADRTARPPFVLSVSAARRLIVHRPFGGAGLDPVRAGVTPIAGRDLPMLPNLPLGPTLTASIELPAIRRDGGLPFPLPPRPPAGAIRFAYRDEPGATQYDIYIPLAATMSATVTLTSPEGPHASVRATA